MEISRQRTCGAYANRVVGNDLAYFFDCRHLRYCAELLCKLRNGAFVLSFYKCGEAFVVAVFCKAFHLIVPALFCLCDFIGVFCSVFVRRQSLAESNYSELCVRDELNGT